jgi:hypothetical protein
MKVLFALARGTQCPHLYSEVLLPAPSLSHGVSQLSYVTLLLLLGAWIVTPEWVPFATALQHLRPVHTANTLASLRFTGHLRWGTGSRRRITRR